MRKPFLSSAILTSLLLLGGCHPESGKGGNSKPLSEADPSLCQFHLGICEKGVTSLELSPASAPSEQPLSLNLELPEGFSVVEARIEGRDMFMGVIPLQFKNNSATAIYGSCSSDYMVWRLFYTAKNSDGERMSGVFDWLADNQ